MLRVTLKDLLGRKLRLALTSLAIVLGVGMVSGTYILTDTINAGIKDAPRGRLRERRRRRHRQARVRRCRAAERACVPRLDARTDRAAPRRLSRRRATSARGRRSSAPTARSSRAEAQPGIGFSIDPGYERFTPLRARHGRLADGVERGRDRRRDRRRRAAHGRRPRRRHRQGRTRAHYTISGHRRLRQLDLARRRDDLRLRPADGTDGCSASRASSTRSTSPRNRESRPASLLAQIGSVLPPNTQVRTGQEQAQAEVNDESSLLDTFRYFLLAFGGIALFVGAFVIANTLSITVAQRTREFATLRALGRELAAGAPRSGARGARDRPRRLGDRARSSDSASPRGSRRSSGQTA